MDGDAFGIRQPRYSTMPRGWDRVLSGPPKGVQPAGAEPFVCGTLDAFLFAGPFKPGPQAEKTGPVPPVHRTPGNCSGCLQDGEALMPSLNNPQIFRFTPAVKGEMGESALGEQFHGIADMAAHRGGAVGV